MKIKVLSKPYTEVAALPSRMHIRPVRQSVFLRKLMKKLSAPELKAVNFTCETDDMYRLGKNEPAMFLMNHSSFTDLQIAATLLADREYHIVCTNDGFVGKAGIMARVGCICAKKFIPDTRLIKDMKYAIDTLNSSILMYPEASYSFDGTQTPLPDSIGKVLKLLKVPVVMIRTKGAFLRDPLYNNLQKRNVNVSAKVTYLLSPEDINKKSVDELNAILKGAFEYDHFREQVEDGVTVDEPFRADGLHRVLYKCNNCGREGAMKGEGVNIRCCACGCVHMLTPEGTLKRTDKEEETGLHNFKFVPDWYAWERECVRQELLENRYRMELPVDIIMMVDLDAVYRVGEGVLVHDRNGFKLTGCDGKLDFSLTPGSSYSLYSDYYWYEIGDMISIGDSLAQYYCFPKDQEKAIVAKARLATEELYKIKTE